MLEERDKQAIEGRLIAALRERPRQQILSVLCGLMPRRLAQTTLDLAGVATATSASGITRVQRKALVDLMDRLPLTIVDRDRGDLAEVDPRSMESRIVPGVFFCGELLDVDGFTGGFNLQAAWSTGRIAGLAAAD